MKEKLEAISKMSKEKIAEIKDSQALNDFKVKVLGKKGELTEILRGMKDIVAEERPVVGSLVNKIRDEIEQMIDEKESEFKNKDLQERLEKEKLSCISLAGCPFGRFSLSKQYSSVSSSGPDTTSYPIETNKSSKGTSSKRYAR